MRCSFCSRCNFFALQFLLRCPGFSGFLGKGWDGLMQVGVGSWLMFEDRWAAVSRFLSRCSVFLHCNILCCSFIVALPFLSCSFFLYFVCLRCSFSRCNFCCAADFVALHFLLCCSPFRSAVFTMQLFVAVHFAVTEYIKQYSWDHQYHHYQYYEYILHNQVLSQDGERQVVKRSKIS